MNLLMRLLREPLLHFLAISGLIFLLFVAVDDMGEAPADAIVITPERIDQLAAGFSSVWKRMPTDDELDALIDEAVREEVYYRGALALGLDRNDTIVRRRMPQKMEFLLDTGASARLRRRKRSHYHWARFSLILRPTLPRWENAPSCRRSLASRRQTR